MSRASTAPKWLRALVPLGVSVALLWGVGTALDAAAIGERLAHMHWGWMLAAAALGPFQVLAGGVRWGRVCRALDVGVSDREAVAEYGLSTALNQMLPGGIAGDAVRIWRQRHHGAGAATHTAVVDRAMGLGALVLVSVLGLGAWAAWFSVPWPMAALAAGMAVVLGGALLSPVGAGARRVLAADGVAQAGLSVGLTVSFLLGFAAAGLAVGVGPGPWVATAGPWLLLAMAVPMSFAGWGPREVSAATVWPLLGATSEEGVAVSAAYGLSVLLGALPGLALWGWGGHK